MSYKTPVADLISAYYKDKRITYEMQDALYEASDEMGSELEAYRKLGTPEEITKRLENAVELPCKVGDTVYEVNQSRNIISKYQIISIHFTKFNVNYSWELKEGIYTNLNGFNDYAIGKTVFLTKEAAESRLKELEDTK